MLDHDNTSMVPQVAKPTEMDTNDDLNWKPGTVYKDDEIIFRTERNIASELPNVMESFNHDTDCLMEDIDVRYLDELKGACDGYKRDTELMADVQKHDPDFKVMYKYKLDKKLPQDKKKAQFIQANSSAYYMDENKILYRWHQRGIGSL